MIRWCSYKTALRSPQRNCKVAGSTISPALEGRLSRLATVDEIVLAFVVMTVLPGQAQAYVDPGTTGALSQILYVVFYVALGFFFYWLRSIKQYMSHVKEVLKRMVGNSRSSKD